MPKQEPTDRINRQWIARTKWELDNILADPALPVAIAERLRTRIWDPIRWIVDEPGP